MREFEEQWDQDYPAIVKSWRGNWERVIPFFAYHRPHAPEITEDAKAWVVSVACTQPKELGLAAELWSISALARHVSEQAEPSGFPRLAGAGKSTVWRILDENQLKPHKITYYLEKRDPDFDRKMHEVLMVYRDVSLYTEGAVHDGRPNPIYTVSVDEKPGVQAIGLTAPDLPPVPPPYPRRRHPRTQGAHSPRHR